MSLWNSLVRGGATLARSGIERLRAGPVRVAVSQDVVNRLVARALPPDGSTRDLTLNLHDGWVRSSLIFNHRLGPIIVNAEFTIERLQVDRVAQSLVLALRRPAEFAAERRMLGIVLRIVDTVSRKLSGRGLLERALARRKEFSVADGRITVDLATLGVEQLLVDVVRERLGSLGDLSQVLVSAGTETVAQRWAIDNARCREGALELEVRFVPPEHRYLQDGSSGHEEVGGRGSDGTTE